MQHNFGFCVFLIFTLWGIKSAIEPPEVFVRTRLVFFFSRLRTENTPLTHCAQFWWNHFNVSFYVYKENATPPPRWNFRPDILRGVAPQYIPLLNKVSLTIVLLYLFIYLFFAEVCNIGSHTYWSWRSLTKRAGPKVMIIYKYQYEKECMLKKMHCYWCLNNCTVREMERGERMGIIFSRCVLWGGGGGGVLNRTHPTRCKQRSQGRDKNSTSPSFLRLSGQNYKQIIRQRAPSFFCEPHYLLRFLSPEKKKNRQRPKCLTLQLPW